MLENILSRECNHHLIFLGRFRPDLVIMWGLMALSNVGLVEGELGGVDEVVGGRMLHHLLARPKLVSDNYRTQLLLEFIHSGSWCLPRRTDLDALFWKNGDKEQHEDKEANSCSINICIGGKI